MKNAIQKGDNLNVTLTANAAAGEASQIEDTFGVFINKGVIGEVVPLCTVGVYSLPKDNLAAVAFKVAYWDNTAKKVTSSAGTVNKKIGHFIEAAATGDAFVNVKLIPAV